MTAETFVRMLVPLGASALVAWDVYARCRPDRGEDTPRRYRPFVSGAMLPAFVLTFTLLGLALQGPKETARMLLSFCFGVFLQILVYDLLLMGALPLLRRRFSAGACAMLWLLPNYLYITQQAYMAPPRPLVVLRPPEGWIWTLFRIWLLGFFLVFGAKLLSHLAFRRQILAGTQPVTEPAILALWEEERARTGLEKAWLPLVRSDRVRTPLSVGLFRSRMRVVLPRREYSEEELRLVFRHELTHIGREDSWSKFFLVFCTALCWFNPLAWVAAKKSAEDLELSCDEAVLAGCGAEERQRYARLLLSTAGDGRGFTTCLSAAASSLRYRLKNTVQPAKKASGALLAGLVCFGMCMSCGYVALAYGATTGREAIFGDDPPEAYSLRATYREEDPYSRTWRCEDQGAFRDWLAGLKLEELTGNYFFQEGEQVTFLLDSPRGTLGLVLRGDSLKISPLWETGQVRTYHIAGGPQQEALAEFLKADPALNLTYYYGEGEAPRTLHATLYRLEEEKDGEWVSLVEPPEGPEETPSGAFYSQLGDTAKLDFSLPLEGGFRVEAEALDHSGHLSLEQEELADPLTLPLAGFDARYTLSARMRDEDGTLYRAWFRFEFGRSE